MKKLLFDCSFKEAVFENKDGVSSIKNVVLLGAESKNKRRYTKNCMSNAVGLYENAQAFVNHPSKAEIQQGMRDVNLLAGKFVNVRIEDGKVKGDFKGLPNDPAAQKFVSIAENMPEIAGMSQNAQGKIRMEGDTQIVEEIHKVFSIDLVASPATTQGIFENEDLTGDNKMDYKEVTMIGLKEGRGDLVEKLIEEGKASRDEEVKKLTEANEVLTKKVDEMEVAQKLQKKTEIVEKALAESELPEEAKTELFKKTLMSLKADDEAKLKEMIDEHIADRMTMLPESFVVNNTEKQNKTTSKKKGSGDLSEAQKDDLANSLKGGIVTLE